MMSRKVDVSSSPDTEDNNDVPNSYQPRRTLQVQEVVVLDDDDSSQTPQKMALLRDPQSETDKYLVVPETPQFIPTDYNLTVRRCTSSNYEPPVPPLHYFQSSTINNYPSGLICLESDSDKESPTKTKEGGEKPTFGTKTKELCFLDSDDDMFMPTGSGAGTVSSQQLEENTRSPNTLLEEEDNDEPQAMDFGTQVQSDYHCGSLMLDTGDLLRKNRNGKETSTSCNKNKKEKIDRRKQTNEEKLDERKQKRQEERIQKKFLNAEAVKMKKLQKEKDKWDKGKFALKSIVAEIDVNVIESGKIGGHLLGRFSEKGLNFRITKNPIEKSIMWKMNIPDQFAELSSLETEVPYVVFVYEAKEFCDLLLKNSFLDHVRGVQIRHPSFTVCYLTNKLRSYVNKREQNHYRNHSDANGWRELPIEDVLCKLTTNFTRVHSRQCIDEADLADHIAGLTSSLATCRFRKKLSWLSVHANGSLIPKGFVDKNLIKRNAWLKALIAIPKVQPRYAIAISKKYPTMRSLLNEYLNPNKSVHEKEILLEDLIIEGELGKEDKRLGEVCSQRVYRILMAQNGTSKTDEVNDGADFFTS